MRLSLSFLVRKNAKTPCHKAPAWRLAEEAVTSLLRHVVALDLSLLAGR
jgi:hypothetical protein